MKKTPARGYVCSKVVGAIRDGEHYVYADAPIGVGEVVAVWAGEIVTFDHVAAMGPDAGRTTVQIDEELFLESDGASPCDWVNHSCDPNLGMRGQIVLVARRPISAGEELCFDYAMTDGTPYDEFPCRCGSHLCRGQVTGSDWRLPSIRKRYEGYFSPYLAERIARLRVAA